MDLDQHHQRPTSSCNETKKRQRSTELLIEDEMQSHQQQNDNDDVKSVSNRQRTINMQNISQMKLEAIFHPKFENEKNDQQIRQSMIDKVSKGEGMLEVSLKHSGSLILWSGGKNYYSKNGTDNLYTHVGELLLRQHFARAWMGINTASVGKEKDESNEDIEGKYRECSAYVASHRLTLSFEVVTSCLGHHADLPKRDFLILIAIADRTTGTFYSTTQIIEFAQAFRLPHNDIWIYQSRQSATTLFELYDNSRETALADYVIEKLSQSADSYMKSLYPHNIFQGQILEGFVIRFVRIMTNDATDIEQQQQFISQLCSQSEEILKVVPPEQVVPNFTSSVDLRLDPIEVLNTNLREVFSQHDAQSAASKLKNLVNTPTHELELSRSVTKIDNKNIDMPGLALKLLQNENIDLETKRICLLIQTLDNLHLSVKYHVLLELNKRSDGTIVSKRYLCIVHILHDSCHQKYHVATRFSESMALFRGFSIELISDDSMTQTDHLVSSTFTQRMDKITLHSGCHNADDGKLILKMKLLPYMIRTFILRNGLTVLEQKGIGSFNQYAFDQLQKWNISKEAINKWLGFIEAWGIYCQSPSKANNTYGMPLPILSPSNYLLHFYHFQSLYSNGFFNTKVNKESSFNGLVVIVGVIKEEMEKFSIVVSSRLGISRVFSDINLLTGAEIANAMHSDCGGIICACNITEGCKNLRLLSKNYMENIFIVMIGCSQMEVEAEFVKRGNPDRKELKKTIGMMNAWRKIKVASTIEVPSSCIGAQIDKDEHLSRLIQTLKEASAKLVPDERPGILVFFPLIPGCGKSHLCRHVSRNSLKIGEDREIVVKEGDKTVGKFWPLTLKGKMNQPSSVFVADKNAPISSWKLIDNICSKTKNVAVAALPSAPALEDTMIECQSNSYEATDALCHSYPYSLAFLAVCMSRVLQRQPNTHNGKLDAAAKEACMVVVKFYCLYRNISVSSMVRQILNLGQGENQLIRFPFFRAGDLPGMPKDLETSLKRAICLQTQQDLNLEVSYDKLVIEQELRKSLSANRGYIESLQASEEESIDSFIYQIRSITSTLSETLTLRDNNVDESLESDKIQLVSLDFDRHIINSVMEEISQYCNEFATFLNARNFEKAKNVLSNDSNRKQDRFINKTHCTFAHSDNMSQEKIKKRFDHIIGVICEASVKAVLFNDCIAALEVVVPLLNQTATPIPSSMNEFTHITVWCKGGIRSIVSNELPHLVENNQAKKVEIESPINIKGKFSYWF